MYADHKVGDEVYTKYKKWKWRYRSQNQIIR